MAGGVSYDAGFDSLDATELRLGLPGSADGVEKPMPAAPRAGKRALPEAGDESKKSGADEGAPVAKAQVVGWPPVRSFRRNLSSMAKKSEEGEEEEAMAGVLVKVSMDGAPYLRKTDLKMYKGYKELRLALEAMFKCFSLGEISAMEGCNGCEYAITYQDKDGDWMLVGDVPWQMFISSCKRLRIMRGSEARGLGSRP